MNAPFASAATKPSPILAMHSRYVAAWEGFNRIDVAETALDKNDRADWSLGYHYQTAKDANNAETDALRQAILYQVPTTWVEAMVLQFTSTSQTASLITRASKSGPPSKPQSTRCSTSCVAKLIRTTRRSASASRAVPSSCSTSAGIAPALWKLEQ